MLASKQCDDDPERDEGCSMPAEREEKIEKARLRVYGLHASDGAGANRVEVGPGIAMAGKENFAWSFHGWVPMRSRRAFFA